LDVVTMPESGPYAAPLMIDAAVLSAPLPPPHPVTGLATLQQARGTGTSS